MAHPAIAEVAVIGVKHPKWDERPVIVAVKKTGRDVSRADILALYSGRIAKWSTPDDVIFVADLPHTATGKISRSEEHTSELQSLMRISYAVFCLKKKKKSHYILLSYQYHTTKTIIY